MAMISSILDYMEVVGNDRVICAMYMLWGDAQSWWGVVSQTRNIFTMGWEEFRQFFNERYYNDTVRTAKMNEFVNLVQGNMTVTEYVHKFDGLAQFTFDLVPTDVARKE